jgi:hypothetical protein
MESGMDDVASQAIASSGDEDEDDLEMEESGSFPQLVMPSIQMPSRRPFTTKGKAMGRLKVLVAGEAGLGKTSLIRSIVQLCEDIVHVDPLSSPLSSLKTSPSPKSRKRKSTGSGTARITEIHASTKAYPPWWTDMEDNRGLRRRKSMSDSILERNVCFVDTPGFGKVSSGVEEMNLTIDYIESLLYRNATMGSMSDGDLLGVISGNGGVQVDLVIYMLSPTEDISNDIQFMQRLSSLTNVIPVIAKADTLSPSEILLIKTSILARLQTTSVKPFLFGKQLDDALLDVQGVSASTGALHSASSSELSTPMPAGRRSFSTPTYPYAICSTAGLESDTMDASLLMASDYLQPLLPSELASLVAQIFDPDSISWLRHSAAKKFLSWRRQMQLSGDSFTMHGYNPNQQNHSPSSSSPSIGSSRAAMNGKKTWLSALSILTSRPASGTASILSSPSPSGVLVPRPNSPFYLTNSNFNSNLHTPFPGSSPSLTHTHAEGLEGPSDFSIARYYNQMHREERFAEVRLAKWAADLQRSLRNERERFEELQRAERAKWLLERVGEEVRDGNILSSPTGSSTRADWAVVRHGNGKDVGDKVHRRYGRGGGAFDSRDPLGLCDLGDEFRKKSFAVVKFLGGISVVGAVVLAVFRVSGWQAGLEDAGGVWGWVVGGGGGGE